MIVRDERLYDDRGWTYSDIEECHHLVELRLIESQLVRAANILTFRLLQDHAFARLAGGPNLFFLLRM